MCGIAGQFSVRGEAASIVNVERMAEVLAHRGPDGDGAYQDGSVALSHRRLAILDLSPAGRQPMMSSCGRYVITLNGEIYNFQELRLELQSKGHQFQSRSDTEVVLAAWKEWGMKSALRLNGMFAFAIWDSNEKNLHLVRDRFGIKPLYYTFENGLLLFASESKAILKHPAYDRQLDLEAFTEYLTFQNLFTDRTLFAGIKMLHAATVLTFEAGKENPVTWRYWDFHFRETDARKSDDEYEEELDFLFQQSVQRQLISDVEVGSFLSGGIDSGAITAIAAGQTPNLKTFTGGFDLNSAEGLELSFDERDRAELLSWKCRTEHYEVVLKSGDMERCMDDLVYHIEEPRVGQSYPNYYVTRLASKFVKVTLAGTGGDELFGGYPWRYYKAAFAESFDDFTNQYFDFWQRLLPEKQKSKLFSPIWNEVKHVEPREIFRSVFEHHSNELKTPEDYINHCLYFEAKTFLHGLFVIEDKIAMAHGLEVRVPFLDNDLVDFAMNLPMGLKLAPFNEKGKANENEVALKKTLREQRTTADGKWLLRKVMERHLPKEFTDAKKQGFSAPDASWFKGESIEFVKDSLYTNHARLWDYLDQKETLALVDEHLHGKENRRLLIWSLLNLESFLGRFFAG